MANNQFDEEKENLQGDIIKKIFEKAEEVADLHAVLTSPRGDFFRRRLLQLFAGGLTQEEIEELRKEFGLEESERHLHKLLHYKLIEQVADDAKGYRRTDLGEKAINAVRELERKVGEERAKAIWQAALGKNSTMLFLKIYGSSKKPSNTGDIVYTPLEMGQISTFLPRTVEGIAAIDKLDDAGLVSYLEDGKVHVNPKRSTGFYGYLRNLYNILQEVSQA